MLWLLVALGAVALAMADEKKPKVMYVDPSALGSVGGDPVGPGDGPGEPPSFDVGEPCDAGGNTGWLPWPQTNVVCSPSLGAFKRPVVGERVMAKVGEDVRPIPNWTRIGQSGMVYKGRLRLVPSASVAAALYAGMIGYPVNLPAVALYGKVRHRYGFGPSVSDGQSFMEFLTIAPHK